MGSGGGKHVEMIERWVCDGFGEYQVGKLGGELVYGLKHNKNTFNNHTVRSIYKLNTDMKKKL